MQQKVGIQWILQIKWKIRVHQIICNSNFQSLRFLVDGKLSNLNSSRKGTHINLLVKASKLILLKLCNFLQILEIYQEIN